jgi:hypothetical protein
MDEREMSERCERDREMRKIVSPNSLFVSRCYLSLICPLSLISIWSLSLVCLSHFSHESLERGKRGMREMRDERGRDERE